MATAKYDGRCWRCGEAFIAYVSELFHYEGEWVCSGCHDLLKEDA